MSFTDFFQPQQAPPPQHVPEPAGFDLIRDLLMRKAFGLQADPYTGASPAGFSTGLMNAPAFPGGGNQPGYPTSVTSGPGDGGMGWGHGARQPRIVNRPVGFPAGARVPINAGGSPSPSGPMSRMTGGGLQSTGGSGDLGSLLAAMLGGARGRSYDGQHHHQVHPHPQPSNPLPPPPAQGGGMPIGAWRGQQFNGPAPTFGPNHLAMRSNFMENGSHLNANPYQAMVQAGVFGNVPSAMSGATHQNFSDWRNWVDQSQAYNDSPDQVQARLNAAHAAGNNPILTPSGAMSAPMAAPGLSLTPQQMRQNARPNYGSGGSGPDNAYNIQMAQSAHLGQPPSGGRFTPLAPPNNHGLGLNPTR